MVEPMWNPCASGEMFAKIVGYCESNRRAFAGVDLQFWPHYTSLTTVLVFSGVGRVRWSGSVHIARWLQEAE